MRRTNPKPIKKITLTERPVRTGWTFYDSYTVDKTEQVLMPNYVDTWRTPSEVTWEPNEPFGATLKFHSWERGRSRTTFWFEDENGKLWPFFATDVARLLTGLEIEGTFQAVKRGQNYGLTFVEPEQGGEDL